MCIIFRTQDSINIIATAAAGSGLLGGIDLVALALARQQEHVDVWQNAATRDGHRVEQLVQLFVVPDRQLDVSRHDTRLLVVARRIPRQLEHLGRQVLHHGRHVDGGACADALCILAFFHEASDAANWELKTGFDRLGHGLGAGVFATAALSFSAFASCHEIDLFVLDLCIVCALGNSFKDLKMILNI